MSVTSLSWLVACTLFVILCYLYLQSGMRHFSSHIMICFLLDPFLLY